MATTPPSQFAALLRRSKFSSFDPHIGQVYTAHDGHAARGYFGLKRPLALRRRNAHITVRDIDSREQQTVWHSAEQQNRWIKMWDETGATPTSHKSQGPWLTRLGWMGEFEFTMDSDLVEKPKNMESGEEDETDSNLATKMTLATRNLESMSDREFDWYLKRVRTLRPAFREYLDKHNPKDKAESTLIMRSLFASNNDFQDFLAHHEYQEYHAPRPRHIEQRPHRYAGLSYARLTHLQKQLIVKPHIGRVLDEASEKNDYLVVTAGMTARLPSGDRGTDTSSVTDFRIMLVRLDSVPTTVGVVPEGLEGAKLSVTVKVDSNETRQEMDNPYPPGSKEYITHVGAIAHPLGMTAHVPLTKHDFEAPRTQTAAAKGLLSALTIMRVD
ncbi:mitochondrial ribosomal protein subunit-domain-containing protein [Trametes gibbosa]|nr:mitochondrial ribosomal protein subunit-domain-containing protein [Trametes gibbosa]